MLILVILPWQTKQLMSLQEGDVFRIWGMRCTRWYLSDTLLSFLCMILQIISFYRGFSEKVQPFSQGICRNLYMFCLSSKKSYLLEPIPSAEELQNRTESHPWLDCIMCKCCFGFSNSCLWFVCFILTLLQLPHI